MGKPLSRPGCFRKSSCCLEKHGAGDGGVGGRVGGVDGGYGDGYVPQRSIYDTMCINQQIDSHHHHPGGSIRRDFGGEGSFSYSTSGSLRVSRSPADMFDPQTRSLTPNPSFVRRLDERAIYDSLKLAGQGTDGDGCHSPGCFTRSVSPSVSSFSAPGVASSSKKHHHYHHHYHGDSTKSRDGRHSWKVLTPPKHLESLELTPNEMMDRGGGYLNPGHYPPPGGQSSSVTSPLISPFSGSPLSSGYHTPVFFSPAKPRPSQTQSLRCSPPQVIQPRHYSQTQSLRLSPPHELRRSPYRAQLVQLSAHDLEQDLRERGGGWGRNEREREWEREREREMERGWAQREWERERERGRLERERARERERRETSTFGTFGYGRPVPLRSDRDSVFLESEQLLDTTPLLLPQPSPSPSPSAAPRMGTSAVGRNRAGLKVGPDSIGGSMMSKFDNGSVGLVLVDSKSGCGPRLISEVGVGNMSEAEIRAGIQEHHRAESWNKYNNGSRVSIKNGSEMRMGSQVKTRPGGRDLEGRVQSGVENMAPAVNKDGHRGGIRSGGKNERVLAKPECNAETIPTTVTDFENKNVPGDKFEIESGCYQGMKPETEAGVEAKAGFRQMENRSGIEAGIEAIVNNDVYSATESSEETKVETEIKTNPVSEPEGGLEGEVETGTKGNTETDGVGESHNNNVTMARAEMSVVVGDKTDTVPADQAEKKTLDIDRIESSHVEKGSRTQKSKSSKSSSRTRPGTATGIRPGAVSPRLNRGLGDLESTGPTEGIESTWPRRIMVRKRTVRQGGALHNLPILPPLPSVLSALEKRFPHALLHSRPAHFSENPLTNLTNATSIVGRCSLKEPSHPETGQGGTVVGRASLKEQNLEHWRVWREHEEPRKSKTKEKQRQQNKEKTEREEKKRKEEKRERETREEKDKREKEGVTVVEGLVQESKQGKSERMIEGKMQMDGNKKKGLKKEQDVEIKRENMEDRRKKMKDGIQEQHGQELEEVVVKLETEEGEVEGGEGGTFGEEAGMQSWDAVLEMVTTLWDDGWEKGEAEAGGDTDSLSGSLQRWPLLRPPVGFGGSHPPSSAASELSLTELERRARELDSDLEHLDLSQPHKDTQDLYPTLLEPQRERADMYQTHPGPQREKVALLTGVGSRSQVSLELSAMASPASDTDRPPVDWSATPGTSTAGTSSNKEDSSPDSNLTLESDSSGVFLSLSNQSQEEAGSDSDQPISGSDLGSSSTSLEKDGEDVGLKEWGREESAELQWCYPSLLNTSLREDIDGNGKMEREESRHGKMGGDEETGKDESGRRVGKIGMVSIIRTPPDHTDIKDSMTPFTAQSEEMPPRKKVTLMGGDSPFPLSPFQQPIKHLSDPNQKPIRSSGLDCGDIDPFVQSDSFVYLAVSTRPASQGEVTTMKEVPTHNTKHESAQQYSDGMKTQLDQSSTGPDARPTHLVPQKPEEGDFLCTDSFVYLAAPACLLLGPAGTTPYSGRESDSESSGSGPVDVSVLGCGSLAGDSDWDSDLSDSDPSHPSRISATGNKSAGIAQSKRPPAELGWDLFGETTEPEVLSELFMEQDRNNNGKARKVSELTTSMAATQAIPMETKPVTTPVTTTVEQPSTTKKVTWQFKPPQRSVCTGSRKEKEKEVTSASLVRLTKLGGGETHRPSSSSSSSSSSSPSSSSSG